MRKIDPTASGTRREGSEGSEGSDSGAAAAAAHAYQRLTPDCVLDALAGVGLHGDGRLVALNSFENRVYQIALDEPFVDAAGAAHTSVVAKFYRPARWSDAQIVEEHAFAAELAAAEVPLVAPFSLEGATLHHAHGFAFSVGARRGGRAPELDDFDVLEWIGRFIARIHNVGAARAFATRPAIDAQRLGVASRDWLLEHDAVPRDVRGEWSRSCSDAIEMAADSTLRPSAEAEFGSENGIVRSLRLHGDCHPGNILWTPAGARGEGPHFVDLDDCASGPAVQDLWMLLSGERRDRSAQLGALLDGYEQLRPFDRRELALIEPLRTLRLIHYSAWLARRWSDPTFPLHFPYFGTSDYWRGQTQLLDEQIEAMREPPLVV